MISFSHSNYDLTFKYQAGNRTLESIEYKKNTYPSVDKATSVAIENIFINLEPAKDFDWRGKVIEKDHLISCVITEGRIDLRLKIEVIVVDYESGYMEEPILIDGSLTVGELKEQLENEKFKGHLITLIGKFNEEIAAAKKIQRLINKKKIIYKEFIRYEKISNGKEECGTIQLIDVRNLKNFNIQGKNIKEGLNIQTYCNNPYCYLPKEAVYINMGINEHSPIVIPEDQEVCVCQNKIPKKPIVDFIFYKCIFEIYGKAIDHEKTFRIRGEVNLEREGKSCAEPDKKIEWQFLRITTKPLDEKKSSTDNSSLFAKLCNII